MFNGRGTQTWPDGTEYNGQFKDNKKHGQGVYTSKEDGTVYKGPFVDNQYEGDEGVMTWDDGTKYVG